MDSVWEWTGDPNRRDGWTVIGEDEERNMHVLVSYDSLGGATSRPLLEGGIPSEWLMPREKAEELHDRIAKMDAVFWPPFNPTVARVEDLEVHEYVYPPEPDATSEQETA